MKLRLEHLTKKYKDLPAVTDFTAELGPGIYGLLGPNGAGKTTLLKMLSDTLTPTSGTISLDGTDKEKLQGDYRRHIGYLPQHFGIYPDFTAMDFMLYMAAAKGLQGDVTTMCREALSLVDLDGQRGRKVKEFSGGMKQRLGIAQDIFGDPDILLFDEPTAGLDPVEQIRFRNILEKERKTKLILLSTHIIPDIEGTADHIMIMKEGRLLLSGTEEEISVATGGRSRLEDIYLYCMIGDHTNETNDQI